VDIVLAVAVTGHLPYVGLMPEAESGNSGTSSLTDVIGIGTLTRLIPRELADEVIASLGRKELRKNKLPARVMEGLCKTPGMTGERVAAGIHRELATRGAG
jgi:hypothetical protein